MENYNINLALETDKKNLTSLLLQSFNSKTKIKEKDYLDHNLPVSFLPSDFTIPEHLSHLYPWILYKAYEIAHIKGELFDMAVEDSQHEFEHGASVSDQMTTKYGLRFFEVFDSFGIRLGIAIQPFTIVVGNISLEEGLKIAVAPTTLSEFDIKKAEELSIK